MKSSDDAIAIIGVGCRFPGAENPEAYWRLLRDGVDAVREVPGNRWDSEALYHPNPATPGKMNTRWGGFIEGVDQFDPGFFNISPREAVYVDPQQRLLLEVAWEAFENAGLAPESVAGTPTGVFVGISTYDYFHPVFCNYDRLDAYIAPGSASSISANRISYFFNLRGPSIAVDTACSSSLAAVHLACQSLRKGESALALAGGVNLMLSPSITISLSQARMMASDGRCKTFDASADGYVRGEGCGLIVLKRLSDALADGETILAVIRGSAMNQDGRSNGLTAPNGAAQQAVIRRALEEAGVRPEQISYIEAHGTGTPLGDPIEFQALAAVLGKRAPDRPRCAVASVKTNIGHLEAAAGIAGLIKVVLAFIHGEIPPHLHLKTMNPLIALDDSPLMIPAERSVWPRGDVPRIAGVSAFGFGGTNVHVVLEEAPVHVEEKNTADRPRHLLTLSAQSAHALNEIARRLDAFLEHSTETTLADVCFTANVGRSHFGHRLALITDSIDDLRCQLRSYTAGEGKAGECARALRGRSRSKVTFFFTGERFAASGVVQTLCAGQPTFRNALNACGQIILAQMGVPLSDCLGASASPRADEADLTPIGAFAAAYGLAQLWLSWGVRPHALLGWGIGEYAAACVAGVFTLKDAIRLVAARSRLLRKYDAEGAAAIVAAPEVEIASRTESYGSALAILASGGPNQTVLWGKRDALKEFLEELDRTGTPYQRASGLDASFLPLAESALIEYETLLKTVRFHPPTWPLVFRTGEVSTDGPMSPTEWLNQSCTPIRAVSNFTSISEEDRILLEIGSPSRLLDLVEKTSSNERWTMRVASFAAETARSGGDPWSGLLSALAQLYLHGAPVDWRGFDRDYLRRKVPLPTYPFERRRYWLDSGAVSPFRKEVPREVLRSAPHPLLDDSANRADETGVPSRLTLSRKAVIQEHRIGGIPIFPGVAHLEIALAAAERYARRPITKMRDIAFIAPLEIIEQDRAATEVVLEIKKEGDGVVFQIKSDPPLRGESNAVSDGPVVLGIDAPGTLDGLLLKPALRRSPGPGEVEIRVHAAGLNFMDVMKAMGLYPGSADGPISLGAECAGEIVRVGEGVEGLRVGEAVVAIAPASFSTFVTTAALFVAPKPPPVSFEEAATFPIAFLTAYYALKHLGQLSKGERILIHSAAGGVGLAAVQLARQRGAEIFATVGNPDKRRYLASLGVRHVMDSRSTSFVEEVMKETDGKGVDVVLNSLAGEAIPKSLSILGPYGRFLELGKTDIYKNAPLGLLPFQRNLSFFAIDMERLIRERPLLSRELYLEVLEFLRKGTLMPLPFQVFSIQDAPGAFRQLASRKSIGKIVLSLMEGRRTSPSDRGSITHAQGTTLFGSAPPADSVDLKALQARCPWQMEADDIYRRFQRCGIEYGPYFRSIEWLRTNGREVLASLHLPTAASQEKGYLLPPALMDGALQTLGAFFGSESDPGLYLPYSIAEINIWGPLPDRIYCYGSLQVEDRALLSERNEIVQADTQIVDEGGQVRVELKGICLKRISEPSKRSRGREKDRGDRLSTIAGPDREVKKGALYVPRWKSAPLSATPSLEKGTWLVFMDELGIGERLSSKMSTQGHRVIQVYKGEQFRDLGESGYVVDPENAEGYQTLAQRLKARGIGPTGVIHLWSCTASYDRLQTLQSLEQSQYEGVYSLLFLTQSMAGEMTDPVSYLWVTSYGQAMEADQVRPIAPEKATLWGLGKVISKEHPGIKCRGIDLETADLSADLLAEIVFMELKLGFGERGEPEVLYRGEKRLTCGWEEVEALPDPSAPLPLRENGVYLIVGGQGGIGLEVAKFFAKKGRARLALIHRSKLDEKRFPDRAAGIRQLQALGAEILVLEGDVSDLSSMERCVKQIEERWGGIHGVVHSAAVLEDGLLSNLDRARFEAVLRPKVQGTWVLDRVTQHLSLDFFILFSSVASLVGPPGQGNYAAANAFQDVFARYRAQLRRQKTIVINWGPWGETGMASSPLYQKRLAAQGVVPLPTSEGIHGFDRALRCHFTQVAFFGRGNEGRNNTPLESLSFNGSRVREQKAEADTAVTPSKNSEDRKLGLLPSETTAHPGGRLQALQETLQIKVAESLKLTPDQIPIDADLLDLGLDSLMALEIINALKRELHLPLSPALFSQHASIKRIAEYILARSGGEPEKTLEKREENGNGSEKERAASIKNNEFPERRSDVVTEREMEAIERINLDAEAVLDETIRFEGNPVPPEIEAGKWSRIFLTGATGFLGAFLLYELLRETEAEIYCLLRAPNELEAKKKVQKTLESYALWEASFDSRIFPVVGNMTQPLLGLSRERFHWIANHAEVIYHNAALTNWNDPYRNLKQTNVLGTQETLRLACIGPLKPLHFTSSIAVFPFNGGIFGEESTLDHHQALYTGYAQSKWVSEKLVVAARSRGLSASVYRPSFITAHSQTGIFNGEFYWENLIKGCIQLGCAPEIDTRIDLVPVDYVSKAIVHLSRQRRLLGKTFHLTNPHHIHLTKLFNWIESFGYPLSRMNYEAWKSTLFSSRRFRENALYPFKVFLKELKEEQLMTPVYECQNARAGLSGSAIDCSPVDDKLLRTYFSSFIRSGFLDPPVADPRERNKTPLPHG